MREKLTLRWVVIKLTGLFFTAYSAFNVFVIVRDVRIMSTAEIILSALVALLFALLTAFAWTSEINDMRFRTVRRIVFIMTLTAVFLLKLRIAPSVTAYLDFSRLETVLYVAAYYVTLLGLGVLSVYYTFIRRSLPEHPSAARLLPISAAVFFFCGLVLEIVLFFVFRLGTEANMLRTAVSRPLFYLSFIGLSVYLMYPPKIREAEDYDPPDDSELVIPDDAEYAPPKSSVTDGSGEIEYVIPDEAKADEGLPPRDTDFFFPDKSSRH